MEDTHAASERPDPRLDRAIRLFEFLARVQQVKSTPIRQVETYAREGSVLWLGELPDHAAVAAAWRTDAPDPEVPVLSIDRVPRPPVPEPPASLRRWIEEDWEDASAAPELRAAIAGPADIEPPATIAPSDADRAEFDAWYPTWATWAAQERADAPVRAVYQDLFSDYTQAEGRSEELELVLGVGCLSWAPNDHPAVQRHIFTQPVTIALDDRTGRLSVLASEAGSGLRFELDMLDPSRVPNPAHIDAVRTEAGGFVAHPLDRSAIAEPATRLITVLDSAGFFQDDITAAPPGDDPVITFAPALILRKRSQRGLLEILQTISAQLAEAGSVPDGVLPLVDPDHIPATTPESTTGAVIDLDDEVFLPLPVNETQLKILRRVDTHAQTLIQGPPGTGKTHTAAALIAHLLAQGKRVLITAETDRALHEVREKLPDAIKPLCVSVVGTSRDDLADLNLAAARIGEAANEHDPETDARAEADRLQNIDRLQRERASVRARLIAARERDTVGHEHAGYRGTLARIAEQRMDRAADLAWLGETLRADAGQPAPVAVADIERWRGYLLDAELVADEAEAREEPVQLHGLPDPGSFASLVAAEGRALSKRETYASAYDHPGFAAVHPLPRPARSEFATRLRDLAGQITALRGANAVGAGTALAEVLAGREEIWRAWHGQISERVAAGEDAARGLRGTTSVTVAQGADLGQLSSMADAVRTHLAGGGALKLEASGMPKLGPLAPKALKQAQPLWQQVRVDGVPPTVDRALLAFLSWVRLGRVLAALDGDWPPGTPVPAAALPLVARLQWHRSECTRLAQILGLAGMLAAHNDWLIGLGLARPDWADAAELNALADLAAAADAYEDLLAARAPLTAAETAVTAAAPGADTPPRALERLAEAVKGRDVATYEAAYRRVERLADVRRAVADRETIGARLSACAHALHRAISALPGDRRWPTRLADFPDAWAWASTGAWIRQHVSEDVNALQLDVTRLDAAIRLQVEHLAAIRAWSHAVAPARISGSVRGDLAQYAYLVGRLGKGTGKYAAVQKAEIRQTMDRCRPAVPVWIMPLYRIADQLQVKPDMFDVVIVDEASQAGVEASFLQYLAPKIVVIGDDRQVSPAGVGINQQELRDLAQQYLGDSSSRVTWQDPQRSLFDEARQRFRGMLTLTEHRRCVPEIIGFSNRIAYEPHGIRLVPVRQYGSDRLDPIKTVFLPDGYVQGTTAVANPVEVDAIATQLEACLADPRYAGKTMGVISLQSGPQAKLIEKALMDRLPVEAWTEHRLRCGLAADFQGAERDVIFLSMVAAPDPQRRTTPLTRDLYIQRYNVAASRAKDQLWVFHSIPVSSLGNHDDMRFALLDYCYGVTARSDEHAETAVSAPEDVRVDPFDSLFEQRVHNRIADRGHTIWPQYEVQGRKIDLAVIGGAAMLAVECDGDFWHGPEHYARDLARQRDLERCGWTFFRVRESEFIIDPAAALAPLWDLLHRQGIHPSGWTPPADETAAPQPGVDEDELGEPDGAMSVDLEPDLDLGLPPARTPADRPPAELNLPAYRAWAPRWLPPVESSDDDTLIAGIVEIVGAEGPVLAQRVYQLYVKAAGGQRVGKEVRRRLNQATGRALRTGRIRQNDDGIAGQVGKTLHLPEVANVMVRALGPRDLYEVPPAEIAALVERLELLQASSAVRTRAVLDAYGLVRLTAKTTEFIDACMRHAPR